MVGVRDGGTFGTQEENLRRMDGRKHRRGIRRWAGEREGELQNWGATECKKEGGRGRLREM